MIELEGRGFAFLAEVFVIYCRLWRHSGIDQVCASWPSPANLRLSSQKRPTAQALWRLSSIQSEILPIRRY